MTWYLRIITPKPNPVIVRDKTGLIWDGVLHGPGTYYLPKGKRFDIKLTVRNEGGTGKVEAVVFINGEPGLRSVEEIPEGGEYPFQWLNRIAEENMDIELKVRPYGETEWTDQYG